MNNHTRKVHTIDVGNVSIKEGERMVAAARKIIPPCFSFHPDWMNFRSSLVYNSPLYPEDDLSGTATSAHITFDGDKKIKKCETAKVTRPKKLKQRYRYYT